MGHEFVDGGNSMKKKDRKTPKILTERDLMKIETARELGLWEQIEREGWESLTNADCGRVGGIMRRKIKEKGTP